VRVPPLPAWPLAPLSRLPRWSIWTSTFLLAVAFALLQTRTNRSGKVRVRGYLVARGAPGVAALRTYSQQWPREPVTLRVGPYAMRYTRAELGASMPTEQACARIMEGGVADIRAMWPFSLRPLDLELAPVIVQSTLSARLSEVRRRVEHQPIPGTTLTDGTVMPGIPGFTIDFTDAVDAVMRALRLDQGEAVLPGRSLAVPTSVQYGTDSTGTFTHDMVTFQTVYRTAGSAAGRAHNVEMAAARLDGSVMPPRGELSFNEVVGERSYARGFAGAKEIAARRIVDGVGGGVCQVAATLHAAAFLGGFELPRYQPHSRPAHYIELGLDTMVSWPAQDMRIANPYPFPVRVRMQAQNGALRVTLQGAAKAPFVEWSTEILTRVKPGSQEIVDDSLAAGEHEVVQEAIDGLTVRRQRTIYLPTGPHHEESILKYPPNDRIVAVGAHSTRSHSRSHSRASADERISHLVLDDF
jgi:vancomycin resistance protein YoaR